MNIDRTVSLVLVGDLMFNREYLLPPNNDRDPEYYFSEVKDCFTGADIVCGNLESTLARGGRPLRAGTGIRLYSSPRKVLPILRYLHFDVLSLGNNHMDDFGGESLVRTKRLLADNGFKTFGAGENSVDARTPLIVTVNGARIGFLGYTTNTAADGISPDIGSAIATDAIPGGNYYAIDDVREDIQKVRDRVDALVLSFHWGHEYFRYPSPGQIELAHAGIDAGADIVYGHHSHCVQGFERYREGLILYSLGNFFFWNYHKKLGCPFYGNEFAIARCDLGPDGVALGFVPGCMDKNNRLRLFEDAEPFNDRLRGYSEMLERPDYAAFWEGYRIETGQYLERVCLKQTARIVKSPADMIEAFRKIRTFGLTYAFERLKAKLSAGARLLRLKR